MQIAIFPVDEERVWHPYLLKEGPVEGQFRDPDGVVREAMVDPALTEVAVEGVDLGAGGRDQSTQLNLDWQNMS